MKKKIFAVISIIIVCVFVLSGCTTKSNYYTERWGKKDVYEKQVYTITIDEYDKEKDGQRILNAPFLIGTGTYTTILTGSSDSKFVLETTLNFSGKYDYRDNDGNITETVDNIIDSTTTKVEFQGHSSYFYPIMSERTYDGNTIEYDSTSGKYKIAKINYKTATDYRNGKAYSTCCQKGEDGNYNVEINNIPSISSKTFTAGSCFDNEQAFYFLRALDKTDSTSASYNVVSPFSTSLLSIGAASLTSTNKFYLSQVNVNISSSICEETSTETGLKDVYSIFFGSTNSTVSGIYLYFGKNDTGVVTNGSGSTTLNDGTKVTVDRNRIFLMKQQMPYNSGYMVYTLSEYEYKVLV